ncbi:hypothetical protein NPIL_181921 [Nephila pilipes]|uniref:Uncharacterized protein n=1 Tax=Nephila pilipes TaxID=299642 RepID=A0A8X6NAP1_NEPPI|nr:hypothetical protein NPIL_181921 [Nephila pilipes]
MGWTLELKFLCPNCSLSYLSCNFVLDTQIFFVHFAAYHTFSVTLCRTPEYHIHYSECTFSDLFCSIVLDAQTHSLSIMLLTRFFCSIVQESTFIAIGIASVSIHRCAGLSNPAFIVLSVDTLTSLMSWSNSPFPH